MQHKCSCYKNYIYKVLTNNNLGVPNTLQSACAVSNIPHKYSVRVTDKYNILNSSRKHCVYTYIQSATRFVCVKKQKWLSNALINIIDWFGVLLYSKFKKICRWTGLGQFELLVKLKATKRTCITGNSTYSNLGVRNILQSACEVISNIPHKYSLRVIDKYNILYTSWKHCVQFAALYVRVRNSWMIIECSYKYNRLIRCPII